MKICTAVLYLLFAAISFAQPPGTLWTKTVGRSDMDFGFSVQQTSDGGYIIEGLTEGLNLIYPDIYLAKTNSFGDTLWTLIYGGDLYDCGYSGQETADGGYVFIGAQRDTFTVNLIYLIKTDKHGDHIWLKTYEGVGYSVEQTFDGGYVVTGYTWYGSYGTDVWLLKTDSLGDTLWTKTYGGSDPDEGCAIEQTHDGGYIIAGHTSSFGAGQYDVYLIKTDSIGETLWTKTYGGDQSDYAYSVQQTTDGGYIICGYTHSFGPWTDFYLIKTDSLGDTLWTRTYGGSNEDRAYCARQTSDGGYIVVGQTYSSSITGYDIRVVKTDSVGDTVWTQTYGGPSWDCGRSGQQTSDGGYIFAGTMGTSGPVSFDVYLIKTEPDVGVSENETVVKGNDCRTTIIRGPLLLPEDRKCKVMDITGRVVDPNNITCGIYFVEIDSEIVHKVIKVR
ncbi:MAG: hypothetical protein JSV53_04060 [candidate division WOR-3 bacterium]|nr:MAG: hypothetical protein JSV53_04060 [candidate division WOR-3 bacterium]